MEPETTYIDEANIFVCDNCGAYADTIDRINHHSSCRHGESKKWEKFYNKSEEA